MNPIQATYRRLPRSLQRLVGDPVLLIGAMLSGGKTLRSVEFRKSSGQALILGNGPSLRRDEQKLIDMQPGADFICVNNFCDDPLYALLRPIHFVLLDAYYFVETPHRDWLARREQTFRLIEEKTDWPLTLYIPHFADLQLIKDRIKNPNVEVVKLACLGYKSRTLSRLQRISFATGLYGPPQINVLLYAIYIALWAGYEHVDVFGADMSFHKDVDVDQRTNELLIRFKHFNEEEKSEVLKHNPYKDKHWKMPEFLELSADTFYAHRVLGQYASLKNIKILNRSQHSLIDAYPRQSGNL